MRIFVLVLIVVLSGNVQSKSDDTGPIFIDAKTTVKPANRATEENGGEDDEISGSGVLGDASGGSGTEVPGVDVKVVTPSARVTATADKQDDKKTTGLNNPLPKTHKITNTMGPETEKIKEEPTTERSNVVEEEMLGGGIVAKQQEDDEDEKVEEKPEYNKVLTTEVVAAIVVGAVCAIVLIAFLVYRLRKKDEGSYALTDGCYSDTYKLRGDGKEAFV